MHKWLFHRSGRQAAPYDQDGVQVGYSLPARKILLVLSCHQTNLAGESNKDTHSCLLDILRMWKLYVFEDKQQTFQSIVFFITAFLPRSIRNYNNGQYKFYSYFVNPSFVNSLSLEDMYLPIHKVISFDILRPRKFTEYNLTVTLNNFFFIYIILSK